MLAFNEPMHAAEFVPAAPAPRALSVHDFHQLAEVPPAFANIGNPQTRRVY